MAVDLHPELDLPGGLLQDLYQALHGGDNVCIVVLSGNRFCHEHSFYISLANTHLSGLWGGLKLQKLFNVSQSQLVSVNGYTAVLTISRVPYPPPV